MTERPALLPRFLQPLFLIVDLGFIAYWAITLAGVIPDKYSFRYFSTLMRDLEPKGFPRPKWALLT